MNIDVKKIIVCKVAIEAVADVNHADKRLDIQSAVAQAVNQSGTDYITYVLAMMIKVKDHDCRISLAKKVWVQTVPPEDDRDSYYLVVDKCIHGLMDIFTNTFHAEIMERKTYIIERLGQTTEKPSPNISAKARNQER